jgi:hypothetical protein
MNVDQIHFGCGHHHIGHGFIGHPQYAFKHVAAVHVNDMVLLSGQQGFDQVILASGRPFPSLRPFLQPAQSSEFGWYR